MLLLSLIGNRFGVPLNGTDSDSSHTKKNDQIHNKDKSKIDRGHPRRWFLVVVVVDVDVDVDEDEIVVRPTFWIGVRSSGPTFGFFNSCCKVRFLLRTAFCVRFCTNQIRARIFRKTWRRTRRSLGTGIEFFDTYLLHLRATERVPPQDGLQNRMQDDAFPFFFSFEDCNYKLLEIRS